MVEHACYVAQDLVKHAYKYNACKVENLHLTVHVSENDSRVAHHTIDLMHFFYVNRDDMENGSIGGKWKGKKGT